MTLVDVCGACGTLFREGEDHCRRCGADRGTTEVRRKMRPNHTGEAVDRDAARREVAPILEPS